MGTGQPIRDYKDLLVWQRGRDLVKEVYKLTRQFPESEKYGLVSQSQRSAVSIPANIAEGYCRSTRKEYGQFLSISTGSASELETLLILSADLGYIKPENATNILNKVTELRRMLSALRKKIKES